jgi:hypothetical protein
MRGVISRLCAATAIASAGCAAVDVGSQSDEVAIPGRWIAPAGTRAIAATQYVSVVDPPTVAPLGRCTSTNAFACSCTHPACMSALPGTRELDAYLRRRFPYLRAGGLYCCRQNSATTATPVLSVHAIGRAIDLMVPMAGGDADNTLGDAVANWLVENAEYVGVQRVVWDRSYWNGERGFGALSSASLPHTDHIHVEVSPAGAARQTPFFTSGASTGMSCAARCEGTRVINADCSSVDCAATGAACMAGPPPRCGAPPPPEPDAAVPVPGAPTATVRAAAGPARFNFVPPQRLFDTRTAAESARLVRSAGASGAPLSATASGTFRDWTGASLPAGATSAWLNITAIPSALPGFLTAYAAGQPRPPTSNVNYFAPGVAVANAAAVLLGASNGVTFEVNVDTHLITDFTGAFAPTGAGLDTAGPLRALDTRAASMPLTGGVIRAIDVRAPAGASGVVGTIAVVAGSAPGFLRVFPCGTAAPPTSNINFAAGAVASNAITSALGGGQLCLLSTVDAHVIVDVTGFLSPSGALSYVALTPLRLLDTRSMTTPFTGRLGARQVIELPIQRLGSMPANVGAVVANVTALGAAGPGFVSAFGCGRAVPTTSSLNFVAENPVGSLVVSAVGGGSLCLFASTRTHLIVDLVGVWTATTAPPVTDAGVIEDPVDNGDDLHPEPDAGAPNDGATPVDSDASASIGDAATNRDASALPGRDGGPTEAQPGCACRAPASSPRTFGERSLLSMMAALAMLASARRRRAT